MQLRLFRGNNIWVFLYIPLLYISLTTETGIWYIHQYVPWFQAGVLADDLLEIPEPVDVTMWPPLPLRCELETLTASRQVTGTYLPVRAHNLWFGVRVWCVLRQSILNYLYMRNVGAMSNVNPFTIPMKLVFDCGFEGTLHLYHCGVVLNLCVLKCMFYFV